MNEKKRRGVGTVATVLAAAVLTVTVSGTTTVSAAPKSDTTTPTVKEERGGKAVGTGLTQLKVTKGPGSDKTGPAAKQPTTNGTSTLVLYDTTGEYGKLGELYAMNTANLTGHFGGFTAHPVSKYVAGEMNGYTATIYIGSTYDEPLPKPFLNDVAASTKPVIWMHDNIWQLTANTPDFTTRYGWNWSQYDTAPVTKVSYKNRLIDRSALNNGGIMTYNITDATKVSVLAEAIRADGTKFPWALRSGNLTYLGEIPFSYVGENDRQLIFADLLFDALAPATAERHRALVRLEDLGPDSDPAELRAAADVLYAHKVPFSFGVSPRFVDPKGFYNFGVPVTSTLKDKPEVVSAIKYLIAKGGTPIMHGWTHQYGNLDNTYNGVSGDDFEFFLAHVDEHDNVILDGPVPDDSTAWATGRVKSSAKDFTAAKLAVPTIFEFPHYAASATDYKAVASMFGTRYERSLYFTGTLSGAAETNSFVGQLFPYVVKDVYGSKVIPENLGNFEPEPYNHHPARFPADLVANAEANLVVRDGFASFFYHPYFGTQGLEEIIVGIKGAGYTFVSVASL